MWKEYFTVYKVDEALGILAERGETARLVAGGTDLILELEREVRSGIDTLIDITRIPELDQITLDENGTIHLGALVTHNQCAASELIFQNAFPLAQAAWSVGAPQIRNRGTVAGNLITASPANDTISPLMAMDASVKLLSKSSERVVRLSDFYSGVRKTVMRPDEMLVEINFPAMQANQRGAFIKLGLRSTQAISLVNATVLLAFDESSQPVGADRIIRSASITLGAVAPVIIHAVKAEAYLVGKKLDQATIEEAAESARDDARPIDDLRSSADYRAEIVRVCCLRALRAIRDGKERDGYPERPVLLNTPAIDDATNDTIQESLHAAEQAIVTTINGKSYTIRGANHKTLLRMLREDAGLTGVKEGCAEGECGACTVFMDGMAVMSCLVPAPRAHGAKIVTIEGLADGDRLHPVQQAFIDEGAVQCGYCTPGFIMSAAKLLEEIPQPTTDEIKQAITGNLCRCTGYYSIVRAIEKAAQIERADV
jgi:xanthine dehydrogenase iron-sulfur cluster and FAD-binding subunit A